MRIILNRTYIITIVIIVGVLVGLCLAWVYSEFKDDLLEVVIPSIDRDRDVAINDDFDIPVYGALSQKFGPGDTGGWWFWVFQPKIVGYETENGVNFVDVEYHFADEEDEDTTNITRYTTRVIISREGEWNSEGFPDVDRGAFEQAVKEDIPITKSFFNRIDPIEANSIRRISFTEFQDLFPVGSYIALSLPEYYPTPSSRDDKECSVSNDICEYASIWDTTVTQDILKEFAEGGYVLDSGVVLLPYSISDDIYRWSEEWLRERDGY